MRNRLRLSGGPWDKALRPGPRFTRWILLFFFGVFLTSLGFAFWLTDPFAVSYAFSTTAIGNFGHGLRFMPGWLSGLILVVVGLSLTSAAMWNTGRLLLMLLVPEVESLKHVDMFNFVIQRRRRSHGPKIVAIGGGTGMPQLLRGLRDHTDHITAIVTVADDGGSSGRLRRQMGLLPPGDFRNNIAALSEAEDLMTRLFQYRFAEADVSDNGDGSELAGHSFGNLFIATMAAVTGSFESGIAESSRVLAVRGRVLPSTLDQVTLCAEICRPGTDGEDEWLIVKGESKISDAGGRIARVFLEPQNARAYPATIQAILQADLIVASPGSFFTSVLPNLLVPSIHAAICATTVPRIYICNVATQPGETDNYTVLDHMQQLQQHVGNAFPTVLANSAYNLQSAPPFVGQWVELPPDTSATDFRIFTGDLIDDQRPWRHDPKKLADRLMQVYSELTTQSIRGRDKGWRTKMFWTKYIL